MDFEALLIIGQSELLLGKLKSREGRKIAEHRSVRADKAARALPHRLAESQHGNHRMSPLWDAIPN